MAEISTVRLKRRTQRALCGIILESRQMKMECKYLGKRAGLVTRLCCVKVVTPLTCLFTFVMDTLLCTKKQLRHKLNPRYKLPSRKHFSQQEIPQLYNLVKETMVSPKLTQQTCGLVGQLTHTRVIQFISF